MKVREKSGKEVEGQAVVSPAQAAARQHWDERQNRKATGIAERVALRSTRTPEEQIALLDRRLGAGTGAKKERARLLAAAAGK